MLLRSKRREEFEDEIPDEPLSEPGDVISRDDVFPEDGVEVDEDPDDVDDDDTESRGPGLLAAVPGPLIAAAAFVPTFLAIFFGLSFVVGSTVETGGPVPPATALMSEAPSAPSTSESVRDPLVAPPVVFVPPASVTPPVVAPPVAVVPPVSIAPPVARAPPVADSPKPAIESTGPTLPPAPPRTAFIPAPASRTSRAPEPPRQPQAAVLNTTPERMPAPDSRAAVDNRKGGRDWTPAAAFADREAASRLASSIQQQGYPVEIRQESSSRPWVLWIGAQPRAGERRR